MESLKIVVGCILAAALYGIVHDQITARICVQYFTVFHPPVFATQSPTLLGIGWGILATWWVGAILGLLLAAAARFGPRAKFSANNLAPKIGLLLLAMGICAAMFGTIGYFKGTMPAAFSGMIPSELHRRFLADLWAHTASYASGFLGGLILCTNVWIRRVPGAPGLDFETWEKSNPKGPGLRDRIFPRRVPQVSILGNNIQG